MAKRGLKVAICEALQKTELCSENPYDGYVELRVVFFETERVEGDIDNRVKYIQDAMNEVVYEDDKQVDRVILERIVRSETQTYRAESPLALDGFLSDQPAFYICVKEFET